MLFYSFITLHIRTLITISETLLILYSNNVKMIWSEFVKWINPNSMYITCFWKYCFSFLHFLLRLFLYLYSFLTFCKFEPFLRLRVIYYPMTLETRRIVVLYPLNLLLSTPFVLLSSLFIDDMSKSLDLSLVTTLTYVSWNRGIGRRTNLTVL